MVLLGGLEVPPKFVVGGAVVCVTGVGVAVDTGVWVGFAADTGIGDLGDGANACCKAVLTPAFNNWVCVGDSPSALPNCFNP